MATATAMNIGAWRDRTNLYISYRQSYTHHPTTTTTTNKRHPLSSRFNGPLDPDSERAGLMSNLDTTDGDAVIEMDLLPPRWLDTQDEITANLANIAAQMKRLDALHAKHVLPGFDDESVKAREEREIESLTQEITRGFAGSQWAIKRIETMLKESQQQSQSQSQASQAMSAAEEKMARNLQISLAARVGEVSALFRKKQAAYLKKLRALGGIASPFGDDHRASTPVPGAAAAGSPAIQNPYSDPAMQDTLQDSHTAQATLAQTSALRQRAGVHDSAIAVREREIEKIAQGVINLAQIFQELNAMVIDQGSLLDRIDYNVERVAENTKEAEKELVVAAGSQKRGVKRKMILLLVLLVVGMFVLLLVKPRRSGGGGGGRDGGGDGGTGTAGESSPRGLVGREMGVERMVRVRTVDMEGEGLIKREGVRSSSKRVEWKKRRRRRLEISS